MKHWRILLVILIFLISTMPINSLIAQTETASPPIIEIELSGIEPPVSSMPSSIIFGGGGGCGDDLDCGEKVITLGPIHWYDHINTVNPFNSIVQRVCGFSNKYPQPDVVVSTPSEKAISSQVEVILANTGGFS